MLDDADGYPRQLSDLIRLSREYISIPPRVALQYDIEQKASYLCSLTVHNICCTFGDWVRLGRLSESIYAQRNSQVQWPFLSMEGSLLRTDFSESSSILSKLQKFQIYLLDISNQKIVNVWERVIGSL